MRTGSVVAGVTAAAAAAAATAAVWCGVQWLLRLRQRSERHRSSKSGATTSTASEAVGWDELALLLPESGASKQQVQEHYANVCLKKGSNIICSLNPRALMALLGYDPADTRNSALKHFHPIKMQTHCSFAKRAVLWCSHDAFSLHTASASAAAPPPHTAGAADAQAHSAVDVTLRAFTLFAATCHKIDGFLVQIPPATSLQEHGSNVRALLTWLSDADPAGHHCMRRRHINSASWIFTFAGNEFFVTTFAPCYSEESSRYQFGVKEAGFALFQPYHSFLLHRVGSETPRSATRWETPSSPRDEIRSRFKRHGRPYFIPERPTRMSNAYEVVTPASINGPIVRWWEERSPLGTATLQQLEEAGWPR